MVVVVRRRGEGKEKGEGKGRGREGGLRDGDGAGAVAAAVAEWDVELAGEDEEGRLRSGEPRGEGGRGCQLFYIPREIDGVRGRETRAVRGREGGVG